MEDPIIRTTVDRVAVEQTMHDYAVAADAGDAARLRVLFADDATARYARDDRLDGGDRIADWLTGATERIVYGQHVITTQRVDVDGDRAEVLAYLVSLQVLDADPDEALVMHSTYHVRMRREHRWLIEDLQLDVGWIEKRRADQTELMKLTRTMPEPATGAAR